MKKTILGWIFITLLIALVGCGTTSFTPQYSFDKADIPLELGEYGSPFVTVYINGTGPYKFLLDTGSTHTHISKEMKDALCLDEFNVFMYTLDPLEGWLKNRKAVKIERLTLSEKYHIDNTKLLIDPYSVDEYDGILGLNLLSDLYFEIDLSNKRLTLGDSEDAIRKSHRQIILPTHNLYGLPALSSIIDLKDKRKQKLEAIIDTGNTVSLSIPESYRNEIWTENIAYTEITSNRSSIVQSIGVFRFKTKLSLGPIQINEPTGCFVDLKFASIGVPILEHFVVSYNPKRKEFSLLKNE